MSVSVYTYNCVDPCTAYTCTSIPNTTDRGHSVHDNTVVTVIAWVTKYGDHQSSALAGML